MILYISNDIPTNYHYIKFSNDYYDLYNTPTLSSNQSYDYYRVYYKFNQDLVSHETINQSSNETLQSVEVTNDFWYRKDIFDIVGTSFIIVFFIIFLINILTSIVRRGGALGGLL